MDTRNAKLASARGRWKTSPAGVRPQRTLAQITEGVRRQREHIMRLDGEDPLRGGVAD